VLLLNIYPSIGRWDDRAHVRNMMEDRRVNRELGCSCIQVKNRMHTFLAGDRSHPQTKNICRIKEIKQTDRGGILWDGQEPCST